MIHSSKLIPLMERKDPKGKPVPFSIKFRKKSTGELVTAKNVTCTSTFYQEGRVNILFPNKEIRRILLCLIVEFNGQEVFI